MQYVRNLSGSVAKAWNSVNPATLSGAIDVIVVEQADGEHSCCCLHGDIHPGTKLIKTTRLASMLPISCPLWQVYDFATI